MPSGSAPGGETAPAAAPGAVSISSHDAPPEIRTARLRLRPWSEADAEGLLPVLTANVTHLAPWIPAHVSTPVPLAELRARIAGFGDDFAASRSWRYGIFPPDGNDVFGEASLFFRSPSARVQRAGADRVEIGYWLRQDVTGRGYATEAARALITLAAELPGISSVEIRCDPDNGPSAAVPRRLGFRLAEETVRVLSSGSAPVATMIWRLDLSGSSA